MWDEQTKNIIDINNGSKFDVISTSHAQTAYTATLPHILRSFNVQVKAQKYFLPLLFHVDMKLNVAHQSKDELQDRKIRCEGTLVYENGRPVDLKGLCFTALQHEKRLSKFYYICRKNFHIKFHLQLTKPASEGVVSDADLEVEGLYHLKIAIQQNRTNLHNFLASIGLISVQQKSRNRLRSISLVSLANKQMRTILQQHMTVYEPPYECKTQGTKSAIVSQQTKMHEQSIMNDSLSTKYTRSEISSQTKCSSSLTHTYNTLQRQPSSFRLCCQQQFQTNKFKFKVADMSNNAVVQVSKINIEEQSQANQPQFNQGGYFTVQICEANVEITKEIFKQNSENLQIIIIKKEEDKSQCENLYSDVQQSSSHSSSVMSNQLSQVKQQMIEQSQRNRSSSNLRLAIKYLNDNFRHDPNFKMKAKYEMDIIKQIQNNSYICRYYESQQGIQFSKMNQQNRSLQEGVKHGVIVMENMQISLKQILNRNLYHNPFLILRELTKSIITLHESGIVHRDIKPGNVMFNSKGQLVIIDFSESIECWREFSENNQKKDKIGFTLPYSPLECSRMCEEGYSNMKIDNWSLGMTASQIITGSLPVSYSKSLKCRIKTGWLTDEFNWCFNLRKNGLNNELILPVKILCLHLMTFDCRKRLCLKSFLSFLDFYEQLIFQMNESKIE